LKLPWEKKEIAFVINQHKKGYSRFEIAKLFTAKFSYKRSPDSIRHCVELHGQDVERNLPKVLILDIETAPMVGYIWGLWDQSVPLNMLVKDWFILSFSAKWLGSSEDAIVYKDQRGKKGKDLENDKALLKPLWKLIDEADICLHQNGIAFDMKKLNAKFLEHEMGPPSPYKNIDTLRMAKRLFSLTSNKLEYMTNKLCTKNKKLKTKKFQGFELWKACLAGNLEAWKEMEAYNKMDVLSLEELYHKLAPWGTGIDFDIYNDETKPSCNCGSQKFKKNGYCYSSVGKYQRYKCTSCGAEASAKGKPNNLIAGKSLLKKG